MEMTLELPQNFVELDQDEMMYLDGGLTTGQRVALAAGIIIGGAALGVALTLGQLWVVAKIFKVGLGQAKSRIPVAGMATWLAGNTVLGINQAWTVARFVRGQ